MRNTIFTLILYAIACFGYSGFAQNDGTGVFWGELGASEPLLLNEKFQGFDLFHSDENTDQGNSNHMLDTDGINIIYGYKNDTVIVPIVGSLSGKIKYLFYQCAFAPDWKAAWSFRDGVENTENVSNGFVEISRNDSVYSDIPTIHGYMIVDLREIEFVEVIQWTHSSCGGNKRGVMCEFSLDDGTTWDTLRYQPGSAYGLSFTKDPTTRDKTSNTFRCQPSAYGMTWEDGIWASNVMLRFGEAGGQAVRIHDLRVYGTYTPPTSALEVENPELKIFSYNKKIVISKPADVAVYNLAGNLIKKAIHTINLSVKELPSGVYLVKAESGSQFNSTKIIIQ